MGGESSYRKRALAELQERYERLRLQYQELLKEKEALEKIVEQLSGLLVESGDAFAELLNSIPEEQMSEEQKKAKNAINKIIDFISKSITGN